MAGDTATKAGAYAQRLLDNEYVQANLAKGVDSLRAAYRRASKRRVEPTRDERLRRQLRQAALSIREAGSALKTDRTKQKRRRGRKVLVVLAIGAGGAAALVAARRVLGADSEAQRDLQTPASGGTEAPSVA